MNPAINMQAMSWVEYHRRLREDDPIVILPVGSVEQHREHKDASANNGNPAVSPLRKDHGCREAGRKSQGRHVVGSQTGVGRHRSHSGSDEGMNKGVLAHIGSDRPS